MIRTKKVIISLLTIVAIIMALITGGYVAILEKRNLFNDSLIRSIFNNISITKVTIFFAIYELLAISLYLKPKEIIDFSYKYRYAIAGSIFVLCIIFQLSGSSIGLWKYIIGNEFESGGELLGISRDIRGDEFIVNTPFAISQEHNQTGKYQYFSDTIRGDKTDVFIVYGQPVYDIAMIFRPFLIGYILLGSSYGLSFFWCGRFIALFMVYFELGMLITNKKKGLSFICAVMVLLAPAIQWWFAVNGLVEMLVFGGLAILLFDKYLKEENFGKRILYATIIAICAGTFALVFYPAWQIPTAYIILGLAIWTIIKNKKEKKIIRISKKDILAIIIVLILLGLMLGRVLIKSWDTVKAVMNTAYPGARCETGGKLLLQFFQYPANMFMTVFSEGLGTNVCESAVFFDLFPIGIILGLLIIFKEKNKDPLLIIMLIIETIFIIWCGIGLPKLLAKITLLYVSPARRTLVIASFLNVLILIRAMGISTTKISKQVAIIGTIIATATIITFSWLCFKEYFVLLKIVCATIAILILVYGILRYNSRKTIQYLYTIAIVFVLGFSSFLVNPVRSGLKVIEEHPVGLKIKEINEKNPGIWIVEGGYPLINFPIMYGAATINSTNTYPDLNRWRKLDTTGQYENIYNRYAHITIELTKDKEAKFELLYPDVFKVYIPINTLKDLNVKYIFTGNDLEKMTTNEVEFNKIYDEYGVKIYQLW